MPTHGTFTRHPNLWIALLVCASWFILALVSSMPAYYISIARGTFVAGQGGLEYDYITHLLRLAGGILLALAIWPYFLRKQYSSYRDYLRGAGFLVPGSRSQQIILAVFGMIAALLLVREFLDESFFAEIQAFHQYPFIWIVLTSLQPAIVEEMLFRGIAFDVLQRRYAIWAAVLLPAILFGFAHVYWGPGRVLVTALVGVLFALLRWRTGSIWGCVAMHFMINFGVPVPAWAGWLAAMLVALAIFVFRKKQPVATESSA